MDFLKIEELPELRNPTLLLAFTGWNDASSSATTAASYICKQLGGEEFASIDLERNAGHGRDAAATGRPDVSPPETGQELGVESRREGRRASGR